MSDENFDYPSDTIEEAEPVKRGKVNWPTVTVATGVSALATGLVLMMGAFGVMHYSASITSSAVTQAQLMADQGNASGSGDSGNSAAANGTQRATQRTGSTNTTGASEARGSTGSGSGGAGGAQRSSASGSGEEDEGTVTVVDTDSDMPPQMDAASLQGHMQYLLADSTSDEEIANNLEAGYDGVPVVRQISSRLNTFSLVYKWRILDGSVYEDGTTMYAILEAELSGYGTKETDMAYYAIDGFWKMSNDSLCALAQSARAECNF